MKHYLSIYYGIDENLPDDIFYREIKLINLQFEEYTEQSVFRKYKGVRENTLIKHT